MDTSVVVDDILTHFGTKGMKWGVRKEKSTGGLSRKQRKAEEKFVKQRLSTENWVRIHNAAADHFNTHISAINSKPEYRAASQRGDFRNENLAITKKYNKEVSDMYVNAARKAAEAQGVTSPSGTKKIEIVSYEPHTFAISVVDVKHQDMDTVKIVFERDDDGMIVGVHLDTMTQGDSFVEEFLKHYGVKGQKWGVRRKATVGPQEVVVRDTRMTRLTKRAKATGGEGHPTHEDAIRAIRTGQISKKSGFKSLSNEELQAYTQRLNLEQNAKRLRYEDSSPAKKFVYTLLRQTGKSTAQSAANDVASQQVKKRLIKVGILAAT